jgi:hypothetical protein
MRTLSEKPPECPTEVVLSAFSGKTSDFPLRLLAKEKINRRVPEDSAEENAEKIGITAPSEKSL